MIRREIAHSLSQSIDRRTFLRRVGALSAGAALGGAGVAAVVRRRAAGGPGESVTRIAMGTFVTVDVDDDHRDRALEAIEDAFDAMDRAVDRLNRHDRRSALAVLNERGVLAAPPRDLVVVLERARRLHEATRGAFDPTVAPLVDLFARRVGGEHRRPSESELGEALDRVGMDRVRVSAGEVRFDREGIAVTLDGIAKGYVVDRMAEALERAGVRRWLVDAGGDIRADGGDRAPWRVAVRNPDGGRYPDVIRLERGAVATSGSYEVFYDDARLYHHIVDPRTGRSPHDVVSASVCASNAMDADGLATAAVVLGADGALALANENAGVDVLVIDAGGSVIRSRGWSRRSEQVQDVG